MEDRRSIIKGRLAVSCLKKLGRSLSINVARAGAGVAARIRSRAHHVVFVGLDDAGKTTLLMHLRYGRYLKTTPTVAFNCERIRAGGASWQAWDVGGADRLRPLWRPYTRATDALVFVVDSSSRSDRLEEARVELARLLKQTAVQCQNLACPRPPLLVLVNKQDAPMAQSVTVVTRLLGLEEMAAEQPWLAAAVSAVTGEGLDEAFSSFRKLLLTERLATDGKQAEGQDSSRKRRSKCNSSAQCESDCQAIIRGDVKYPPIDQSVCQRKKSRRKSVVIMLEY